MAPVTNGRVIFAKVPKDFPVPGQTTIHDTTQTIDLDVVLLNGGFLIKTLVLSVDPFHRRRMRAPETKSYPPPFTLGGPIMSHGVGVVLRSENSEVAVGKYLYGVIPHQENNIFPDLQGLIFLEKNPKLPWTVYVGAAGMPKAGYLVFFVRSATDLGGLRVRPRLSPPVQERRTSPPLSQALTMLRRPYRLVVQLAKRDGLKIIASAGSNAKVDFMKQIRADIAFNYKPTNTRELLEREGPIDIYWDNVGGEILEAALNNANIHGRFIECEMISGQPMSQSPRQIINHGGYNTGLQGVKLFRFYRCS
ncbi:Zinc-type alcohol dehydrogenase-like protein PB24D3.08c [Mycena sanguinolenta]|uniref:Zinc-type alcohol dehydrogenase-like protein PB24D3.08c n=1 Tax=Mycena sanguinolenta TaxID=230812 RepID=A0A8H7CL90_9AGAR|nr:Zinc-type alcohol dehydrogenase-like protein PB24D3.08c [Mycena sanguinolenta]